MGKNKKLDMILNSPVIEYGSYVPSFSKIIGKTFGNIKKEFNVKIDHYHKSPAKIDIRESQNKSIVIRCEMSLDIWGLPREINKLREKYNLP